MSPLAAEIEVPNFKRWRGEVYLREAPCWVGPESLQTWFAAPWILHMIKNTYCSDTSCQTWKYWSNSLQLLGLDKRNILPSRQSKIMHAASKGKKLDIQTKVTGVIDYSLSVPGSTPPPTFRHVHN